MKNIYIIQDNQIGNIIKVDSSFVCDNITQFDIVPEGIADPNGYMSAQQPAEILTQSQKDFIKYKQRASVKDDIIAQMATENMERVRNGVWTVSQLVELTQDAGLKNVLDDVNTLSFELAQAKIQTLTNPLLTTEIKNSWIMKLQANLFNT